MKTEVHLPAVASRRDIAALGGDRLVAQDRLDLGESFSFFRRHALLILATTLLVCLVVLGISLVMPKTYRAQTAVML
ncbi:MAG: hypothetical protein JSR28_09180, partial [Proteobacteria bacterium]|nr:hypothetical protein [Pseudomonadota bacterium]